MLTLTSFAEAKGNVRAVRVHGVEDAMHNVMAAGTSGCNNEDDNK